MENRHEQPPSTSISSDGQSSEAHSYDNVIFDISGPDEHQPRQQTECSPMVRPKDERLGLSPVQLSQVLASGSYDASSMSSLENGQGSTSTSDAEDEDAAEHELTSKGWLTEAPAELCHEMNGVALPSIEPPCFGDVKVENSTNVHLGNRTFYKGPVTIKQVVYASNSTAVLESKPGDPDKQNGSNLANGSAHSHGSTNLLYDGPAGDSSRVLKLLWRYRCAIAVLAIVVIIALITLIAVLSSGIGDSPKRMIPASPNDTSINNDPTIHGVRIVSRVEWLAQPPAKPPTPLKVNPPIYVIISHTATTFCYTQAQCTLNVRVAQTFHIESRGWDDIGYSFLVGGDGLVYEGRGWGIEGSHTFNYNDKSIGISFIGTFNSDEPTKAQLFAAKKLIEYGVENGKISPNYKLLGHRQCTKTESPGEVLYNIIKTWDHWSPTP